MATNNSSNIATGASGTVLTGNGVGTAPTFQAAASGGIATIGSSTDKSIVTWSGTAGTTVQNNANLITTAAGEFLGGVGSASNCTFSFNGHASYGIFYTTNTLNLCANGTAWVTIPSGGTVAVAAGLSTGGLNSFNSGGMLFKVITDNNTTANPITTSSHIVSLSNAAARTISISSANTGQVFTVKDAAGTGLTANIVITPASGTIDGAASYTIATNYGFATFYSNGTNYFIIAKG